MSTEETDNGVENVEETDNGVENVEEIDNGVENVKESDDVLDEEWEKVADLEDRKLFVGGLPVECKDDDIKEYFETYGEVEDVITMWRDRETKLRHRGFSFVVFSDLESVQKVLDDNNHKLLGK